MIDFEKQFGNPTYKTARQTTAVSSVFALVYGWMAGGLALSGLVAWYTWTSGLWERILTGGGFMICVLAEFALVFALSAAIGKIPTALAYLLFAAYAAVNGLTLSVVFIAYELALVQKVFFITAGMFGGLALWGTVTKGDLSSVGSICGMALWGLILAMIVGIFWHSTGLELLITFAGIAIFAGLTMYDAQKIKMLAAAEGSLDADSRQKVAIMGALALYLDFINLFLYLLRFFGRKK